MAYLITALLAPFLLIGLVALGLLWDLLLAWPLLYAWNYAVPGLFGLAAITYWQAVALLVVSGLLFKSGTVSSNATNKN